MGNLHLQIALKLIGIGLTGLIMLAKLENKWLFSIYSAFLLIGTTMLILKLKEE